MYEHALNMLLICSGDAACALPHARVLNMLCLCYAWTVGVLCCYNCAVPAHPHHVLWICCSCLRMLTIARLDRKLRMRRRRAVDIMLCRRCENAKMLSFAQPICYQYAMNVLSITIVIVSLRLEFAMAVLSAYLNAMIPCLMHSMWFAYPINELSR